MLRNKLKTRLKNEALKLVFTAERFRDEVKGVAAIEFAFLAPLMLLMYVGTIEISSAMAANRKLSRVSSTIGDLLTQTDCFTDATITDIMKIADDIMYPYDDTLQIRVTGVLVDSGTAEVQWSRAEGTTPAATGSAYAVPNRIKIDGNFLVAAKINMSYQPTIGWLTYDSAGDLSSSKTAIDMEEELFLRPRVGDAVEIKSSC